jgi:hypothetical protein
MQKLRARKVEKEKEYFLTLMERLAAGTIINITAKAICGEAKSI